MGMVRVVYNEMATTSRDCVAWEKSVYRGRSEEKRSTKPCFADENMGVWDLTFRILKNALAADEQARPQDSISAAC